MAGPRPGETSIAPPRGGPHDFFTADECSPMRDQKLSYKDKRTVGQVKPPKGAPGGSQPSDGLNAACLGRRLRLTTPQESTSSPSENARTSESRTRQLAPLRHLLVSVPRRHGPDAGSGNSPLDSSIRSHYTVGSIRCSRAFTPSYREGTGCDHGETSAGCSCGTQRSRCHCSQDITAPLPNLRAHHRSAIGLSRPSPTRPALVPGTGVSPGGSRSITILGERQPPRR